MQHDDELVPIGTEVRVHTPSGYEPIKGMIEGHGSVIRDGSGFENGGEVIAYEVEVTEAHVGYADKVTLEGERMLLYRGAFDVPGDHKVSFTAKFTSIVKGGDREEARTTFISSISETLTWDGDEEAPDGLEHLEMQVL